MKAFRLRGKERTLEDFGAWLTQRSERDGGEAEAGVTNNPACCPIARWLVESDAALRLAKVNPDEILAFTHDFGTRPVSQVHTPAWVMRFIDLIDTPNSVEEPISYNTALKALAQVMEQAEDEE